MCNAPVDHKSTRIFFRSVQTGKNGSDPSFLLLFKKRKAESELFEFFRGEGKTDLTYVLN